MIAQPDACKPVNIKKKENDWQLLLKHVLILKKYVTAPHGQMENTCFSTAPKSPCSYAPALPAGQPPE